MTRRLARARPERTALPFLTADSDQLWERRRSASTGIQQQRGSGATTIRLIVILRNPIERAYSHWAMEHRRGNDPLPFALALEQEEARCREALPLQHRLFSYIDRGFYSAQIRRIWRFFGREQVLVLRQDDLRHSPEDCLDRIWQHLSISSGPPITPLERHNGEYDCPMPPACRQQLRKIFWQEIGQLEQLLGWDCSDWLRS